MGFCYEKAYDGTVIKTVTDELRDQTRKYYDEHHARMDGICGRHPRVLLLDIHSFSEETLPEHILKRTDRIPDVCIGADWKYTPHDLTARVERRLDEMSLLHRINTPYSGTFVPNAVLNGRSSCDLPMILLLNKGESYSTTDPVLRKRYWRDEFVSGKYRFLMYSQWYDDNGNGATKKHFIDWYNTL